MTDETSAFDQLETTLSASEFDEEQLLADRALSLGPVCHGSAKTLLSVGSLPPILGGGEEEWAGIFEVQRKLNEGGAGEVLLARQKPFGRQVVLKRLRRDLLEEASATALLREAAVMARLDHPNIVPVYLAGRDTEGQPVIAMKHIQGLSWAALLKADDVLADYVEADDYFEGHLEILVSVCRAVEFAHDRGVLHRDLKPHNVMIGTFGEVYLLDWGLAVALNGHREGYLPTVQEAEGPAGTPAYMAPEMSARGQYSLSKRTDVYLLGSILYHIICGRPPHSGVRLSQVVEQAHAPVDLPEERSSHIDGVLRRAMAVDPQNRFESVAEFRREVEGLQQRRESRRLSSEARRRFDALEGRVRHAQPNAQPNAQPGGGEPGDGEPGDGEPGDGEPGDGEPRDGEPRDGKPGDCERECRRLFGECRFGFEQALEVWPGNLRARRGLHEATETMVEHELRRGAPEAAALLLRDLEAPAPELEQRVRAARRAKEERQKQLERLKREAREGDLSIAEASRSLVTLMMGGLWSGALGLAGVLAQLNLFELDYRVYVSQGAMFGLFLVGLIWVGGDRLLRNRANRRLVASLFLVFLAVVAHRLVHMFTGAAPLEALAEEPMVYGGALAVMGVTLDDRLLLPALFFVLTSLLAVGWGSATYLVVAAGNLLSLGLLAWLWRPTAPNKPNKPNK